MYMAILTSVNKPSVYQIVSFGIPQLDIIHERVCIVLIHHVCVCAAKVKVAIFIIVPVDCPACAFIHLDAIHVEAQSISRVPRDIHLVPSIRIQAIRRCCPPFCWGTYIGSQSAVAVIDVNRSTRHEVRVFLQFMRLHFKGQCEARRTAGLRVTITEHLATEVDILTTSVQVNGVTINARLRSWAPMDVDSPRAVVEATAVDTVHVKPYVGYPCGEKYVRSVQCGYVLAKRSVLSTFRQ